MSIYEGPLGEALDAVLAEFDKAEARLKAVEHLEHKLLDPAVNELRYAGHHLCRALTAERSNNTKDAVEEAKRAEKHCRRSGYDAVEAGLLYYLELIAVFQQDYKNVDVTGVIPDYVVLLGKAREANQFIQQQLPNARDDRDKFYEDCSNHFDVIKSVALSLDDARIELNKKIRSRKVTAVAWIITTGIALVGTAFGALIYFAKT